jgi:hypothetical protein
MAKILKFPLNETEINLLDNVFKFNNAFRFSKYSLRDYRYKLIKKIRSKYSFDEFYNYELISEKIFWNIKYLLENGSSNITKDTSEKIQNMVNRNNSYRSFINKVILIDDNNSDKLEYYYKPQEGSSKIFSSSFKINKFISQIMCDKKLYDSVINNPDFKKYINDDELYYSFEYGFPNLNFGKPFMQSENYRKKRIKLMYYMDNIINSEKNWFKLIVP